MNNQRSTFYHISGLILIGLLLTSCSTVRVKYEATIVDDYFKTAQFEYYQSYPLDELRKKCMLTAIFLGGACWNYLKEPNEQIIQEVQRDARLKIEEIFGPNNFGHRNITVNRFGWNNLPMDYGFTSGDRLRNNYQFYHQQPDEKYPSPVILGPSGMGEN